MPCAVSCRTPTTWAEDIQFTASDSETARLILDLIHRRHLEKQPVDDTLSAQLLDSFVEAWDSSRLYFLASDIDEFNASRYVLDDQLAKGDVGFAKTVFDRFRLRQSSLVQEISELIDADHDFTVDEVRTLDFDAREWASSKEERRERWRKRIKSELLAEKLDGQADAEARTKLHRRYQNLLQLSKQMERHELLELYLTSLTRCLDPHSSYLAPASREEFEIAMKLRLQGIGALLRSTDGITVVEEVVRGGAAAADGRLSKGDTIIAVGQNTSGPMQDIVGFKIKRVVELIRGPAASVVRLRVSKATGESVVYKITRSVVKLEEQEARGLVVDVEKWLGEGTERLGVLSLPSFYRDFQGAASNREFKSTSRDVRKILDSFRRQHVDAVLIDLRGNGGGALEEAVAVSGLFVPTGPIVQVHSRGEDATVLKDQNPDMPWRGPLVLLCDRLSASASEIFAGAMKDYDRALVVGDQTTHGKGSVQNVMSLTNGFSTFRKDRGAVKLTIGKWYRINGNSCQIAGVSSDIILPSMRQVMETGESKLDNALPFDQIRRVDFVPFTDYRSEVIVKALRQSSRDRVGKDKDFERLAQKMKFMTDQQQRKLMSLKESVAVARLAKLKSLSSNDTKEGNEESTTSKPKTRFAQTFYNREVVHIVVDYIRLLEKQA